MTESSGGNLFNRGDHSCERAAMRTCGVCAWLGVIVSKVNLDSVNDMFCRKQSDLQNVINLRYGGSTIVIFFNIYLVKFKIV
jgi:hypothetical protein